MIISIRFWMFLNPYDFRINTLILLLVDSMRAFDNPCFTVAMIASLCRLIFLLNSTNGFSLLRHAQDNHAFNSSSIVSLLH